MQEDFVPVRTGPGEVFEDVIAAANVAVRTVPATIVETRFVYSLEFQRAPALVREAQTKLADPGFATAHTASEVDITRRAAQAIPPPLFVVSMQSGENDTKVKANLAVDPFTGAWHAVIPASGPMGIRAGFALVTMPATLEGYAASPGSVTCSVFLHMADAPETAALAAEGLGEGEGEGEGEDGVRHNDDDIE